MSVAVISKSGQYLARRIAREAFPVQRSRARPAAGSQGSRVWLLINSAMNERGTILRSSQSKISPISQASPRI